MSSRPLHAGANLLRMLLRRSRGSVLLAIIAGIISGGSTTALIALINHWLKVGSLRGSAMPVAFVALCVVRLSSGIGCHLLLIRLSQAAIFDLRLALCSTILASPLRQLETTGSHRLMAAFTEDMVSIANVVINVPYMFVNGIVLASCLLYVGWLSWAMLGGIGVCLILGAISYLVPVVWANRQLRLARSGQDQLFGNFRALTEGVKQLKLHRQRRNDFVGQILAPAADAVRHHNVAGVVIYSAAANWSRLLFFVYVGVLLLVAPHFTSLQGPSLSGCVLVLLYMMAPLEAIMNSLPHFAQANVAVKHIAALDLSLQPSREESYVADEAMIPSGAVLVDLQLSGVRYTYPNGDAELPFSLGPIDLKLRAGELVFLAGGNGSGKTTLAKLICGLYLPQRGHMYLNDQEVGPQHMERYREQFSVVFNDFCLFDSLLGLGEGDLDARAGRYLDQFQLGNKVKIENGVFSTTALSQGQRKRLAMLVALLEDRPIYVFDEWAADQDPQFKHVFYDHILPELKARGKAILVITHDDRYFDIADRIVKLEDGKLSGADQVPSDGAAAVCVGAIS